MVIIVVFAIVFCGGWILMYILKELEKQQEAEYRRKKKELEARQRAEKAKSSQITPAATCTVNQTTSATAPKETIYKDTPKQRTNGLLPAIPVEAWDGYVSPSGGYINWGTFQVSGLYPETNRRRKRTYKCRDEASAIKQAQAAGLTEPFTVTVLPSRPPSERQLEYAKALDAVLPEDACLEDVSAIISRIVNEDERAVSPSFASLAFQCGLNISRYSGKQSILENAECNLSPEQYKAFKARIPPSFEEDDEISDDEELDEDYDNDEESDEEYE